MNLALGATRKATFDRSELDISVTTPFSAMGANLEEPFSASPSHWKADENIGFSEIPKEEVLATIKEGAFCYLDSKPSTSVKGFKRQCEKISLKGAVYGQIEIIDSKYISFSPSIEERPDDNNFRLGALVTIR